MRIWAGIILIIAFAGTLLNLIMKIPVVLVLHDIALFLITLGMLVRMRSAKRARGVDETLWAVMVLLFAYLGTMLNIMWNTPPKYVFHDMALFLLALGILVRTRLETKEAAKEESQ